MIEIQRGGRHHNQGVAPSTMAKILFVLALAIMVQVELVFSKCTVQTMEGVKECVFPFYYYGWIYNQCTTSNGDSKPWCAYRVDENGRGLSFEACDSNCPGVIAENTMTVHKDNEVGKCSCGVPNTSSRRIIGGKETEMGEYPWQVAVLMKGIRPMDHECGGTLVGDRHVITAAHCVHDQTPEDIHVIIGDTTLGIANDTTRFTLNVSEIINHPEYVYEYMDYSFDISVLVLSSPVDLYAYPNIKPACLPVKETKADIYGKKAVVSGWGYDSTWLRQSNLQEVTVEILSICGSISEEEITENMMCAGVKNGGKDSCSNDSGGGPLVTKSEENNGAATLVGVVSWGYGCAKPNFPGVYADVGYFMQNKDEKEGWLMSQLTDSNTCPPPASSTWHLN